MELYWEAVEERVCRKCIDGDRKGNCLLGAGEQCPLKFFFPQIVAAVTNVSVPSYRYYIESLRANVCTLCEHLQGNQRCVRREAIECALDRYYPLVVEVIETVAAGTATSSQLNSTRRSNNDEE